MTHSLRAQVTYQFYWDGQPPHRCRAHGKAECSDCSREVERELEARIKGWSSAEVMREAERLNAIPVQTAPQGAPISVLDHGFVRLVDHMGDDMSVVRAARVSYAGGESKGAESDRKLVEYMMRNHHTSPFESIVMTFHVKAPIFVFRQWHRHRTQSYSELSARYTEMPDEFYAPTEWRRQDTKNKQGSVPVTEMDCWNVVQVGTHQDAWSEARQSYQEMLNDGVAREMARMVLPVSLYSEMYATVDLHNLMHFLRLRMDSHAQWEMQQYANALHDIASSVAPWSMAAWDREQKRQCWRGAMQVALDALKSEDPEKVRTASEILTSHLAL